LRVCQAPVGCHKLAQYRGPGTTSVLFCALHSLPGILRTCVAAVAGTKASELQAWAQKTLCERDTGNVHPQRRDLGGSDVEQPGSAPSLALRGGSGEQAAGAPSQPLLGDCSMEASVVPHEGLQWALDQTSEGGQEASQQPLPRKFRSGRVLCWTEGCRKTASFGEVSGLGNGTRLSCARHREPTHVDLCMRRCLCQAGDCPRVASFGDVKTRARQFCVRHRAPGMKNLKTRRRTATSCLQTAVYAPLVTSGCPCARNPCAGLAHRASFQDEVTPRVFSAAPEEVGVRTRCLAPCDIQPSLGDLESRCSMHYSQDRYCDPKNSHWEESQDCSTHPALSYRAL